MSDDETFHDRSIRNRQTLRIVVWVVIAVVLVAFALSNTQDVEVDWVFGDSNVALWIVIAGSAIAGALIGYIARWRRN